MSPAFLVALAAGALVLARRGNVRPVRPVGPPRPPGPVTPPGRTPPGDGPPVEFTPPQIDPSSILVTDPDLIWEAKGVLWRWNAGEGAAAGVAPALAPAYGLDDADQLHAWSERDGEVLSAFLSYQGLTPDTRFTRGAGSALSAWSLGHPDAGAPPVVDVPPAPVAAYFVVRNRDGGLYQIAERFFGGTDVWRAILNAQPDAGRRAQILANKMNAGWRLKIPADLVARYTAADVRPLETYSQAVAVDGKVSET